MSHLSSNSQGIRQEQTDGNLNRAIIDSTAPVAKRIKLCDGSHASTANVVQSVLDPASNAEHCDQTQN